LGYAKPLGQRSRPVPQQQGIVRYTVRAGCEEAFLPLLREFVEAVRGEPGNLSFDAYQSLEDERTYVLLGRYVSRDAVLEHRASEHFRRLVLDEIAPLLDVRQIQGFPVPEEHEIH
jgi:quinol monooxygenase YgiN